jgi:Tol biopolymer transport system component
MPIRMTLLVLALVALAAPFAARTAPTGSATGRIAFATDRAENLRRVAIYSIGLDGRGRRLVARPEPPVAWLARSRDGKRMAYTSSEGSTSVLYVAGVSGESPTRIPAPGGAFYDPVFSPNGRKLAVTRLMSCDSGCRWEIDIVGADGSGFHRVAEIGTRPSWSPDGRKLVYQNGPEIRVVGSDGRKDRVVGSGTLPQWAPRGNRIVFVATRGGYGAACFVDADGSPEECSHGFSAKSILWAPDGKSIAFRHSRKGTLGILDAHGRHLRLLGKRADRITPAAWSPDATKLAFLRGGLHTQILVRSLRGPQRVRQVTREPKFTTFSNVQWRNRRISYVVRLDMNDLEIAVMNGDGTGTRTLTHNDFRDREPAWSPDGREIVFSRTEGPSAGLRLVEADGSGERALTRSAGLFDSGPAWSPDGSRIAFIRAWRSVEPTTLLIVDRDGTNMRKLSSIVPLPSGVSWSPDGRSLVVTGRVETFGAADLFIVDVEADTSRRLVTGLAYAESPAWSPDGSRIMFAGPCAPLPCPSPALYEIRRDGTGLKRLVVGVSGISPRSAWTTDGRILFTREFRTNGFANQAITVANEDGTGEVALTRSLSVNIDPAWSR